MNLIRKLIRLLGLVALIVMCAHVLPTHVPFYDQYIYYPFQEGRIVLLGWVPFSVGDVLYVMGGAALLYTVVRWVYYLVKFREHKRRLAASVLNTINAALFVYLFFLVGWGANYSKVHLSHYWGLQRKINDDYKVQRAADSMEMIAFNAYLVQRLKVFAPQYRNLPLTEVDARARAFYQRYTDSKVKMLGLDVKPSLFGYFMERVAVDGYYNPFTGEGQINSRLPGFVLPFVVSHEMAHQAGIAAEGDANLMAYALGTKTADPSFNYSAYLNIWLYANSRLFRRDSVSAKQFAAQLNKLTAAHLDTLEELSKKYDNEAAKYSTDFYDSYLKMHHQKDGIRSYGNVVTMAWLLEQNRQQGLIKVP
jgi:hypothetical protein